MIAVLSVLAVPGCYTQFAKFETLPSEQVITVLDTNGNLVREIRQTDTVQTSNGETCIWERDQLGYPYLHCYPQYYPREWYRYHNSPWWYRNDEHLYSADRCPPYYYFDENCGCCRYYLNNPNLTMSSSSSGRARVAAGSSTPVSTDQIPPHHRDTNVSISATTRHSQTFSPQQFFQNPAPVTTTVNSTNASSAVSQQKSDSLKTVPSATAPGAPQSGQLPADTTKSGSVGTAVITQTTPAIDSAPPPAPTRVRRTMRSR